jgi:NADH-quinone oxidoreductase subunit M
MFDRVEFWLLVAIFLPTAGALVVWLLAGRGRATARQSALITTLLTFAISAFVISKFPAEGASDFALYEFDWLGEFSQIDVRFSVGLDGLSLWMFGLSALLSVTAVLVSWEAIEDRAAGFYALLLLLETGMLGVFAARDIILFYIFFEFTLIPLFFLIGIWGSEERRYAAMKFFLFTLAGSLLTFLGLLAIVLWHHSATGTMSFSIPVLTNFFASPANRIPNSAVSGYLQLWIFLALFAGFAIKVPLFPLHTWLPLAHVQAPTAGSVILAGILLKIGTYGFVRFCFPLLPDATAMATPWLLWISVVGIVYGALVALAQADMKRLIAYSSVSHLGFVMLGIFALNRIGMQGGVLQMINHGLSTGGLFAVVGMLYERYHTRQIRDLGGLARRLPLLATFMVLFTFSSVGLPGMNGFAGEFLILVGMFQRAWAGSPIGLEGQFLTIAVLAVFGVVLGAWYMLWLVERVFFGPLREPGEHAIPAVSDGHRNSQTHSHGHVGHTVHPGGEEAHAAGRPTYQPSDHGVRDMSLREVLAVAPLLVFVLWIGLYPNYFLSRIGPAVDPMTTTVANSFDVIHEPPSATAQLRDESILVAED